MLTLIYVYNINPTGDGAGNRVVVVVVESEKSNSEIKTICTESTE